MGSFHPMVIEDAVFDINVGLIHLEGSEHGCKNAVKEAAPAPLKL